MLYLYAFAGQPAAPPEGVGIDGGALRVESIGRVAAVVGGIDAGVEPTEEAVVAHARVVDEVAGVNAAVVPVRFGAAFRDSESLRAAVSPREGVLAEALERVRGCVELGVRVLGSTPPQPRAAASGLEYMRARLEAARSAERVGKSVHEPLAQLARASDVRIGATPSLLLSAAYLVERDRVAAFRDRVEELAAAHSELAFACTGPWPPYSFGTMELAGS